MSNPESIEQVLLRGGLRYRSAEARSSYLDGACGDDQVLREQVEALLQAHQETQTVPASPEVPSEPLGEMPDLPEVPVPLTEKPGDRIGRYKLLQKIGEGGFGVVYEAEQEEPVRRRVALKIIKLGMDTRSVVGRFEAERQALALMDHPGIAKVLDAGATHTGRPYFVMELVKGIRITEYCDQHKLDTEKRLELFMQVCRAVQHAHQKGVIHRDLKPGNILVSVQEGEPVPKVIDFGIAKAIDRRLTEKTVVTELEQFMGTPAYMSPEQAEMSGLDVDTRTDIYSLGVLLYELLTGQTPFDREELMRAGLDEMRKQIREVDPPKPSTRLTTLGIKELETVAQRQASEPARLKGRVRGDLDWIVMKTLEKDRTRRYETANALAKDVQRHLNDEAVDAVAPSAGYQLSKFARRNRLALTAGGAVVLALVLGLVASLWQGYQAQKARVRAENNRQETDDLMVFMLDDMAKQLEPLRRLDLIQPMVTKVDEYFARRVDEKATTRSEYNRSLVLENLGEIALDGAQHSVAISNFLSSVEIREQLLAQSPNHRPYQLGLVKALLGLAQTHLVGGTRKGVEHLDAAQKILYKILEFDPEDLEIKHLLARSHWILGGHGRSDGFSQAYRIALELTEKDPLNKKYQAAMALYMRAMGRMLKNLGIERRIELCLGSINISSNLLRHSSQNLRWKKDMALAYYDLGNLYADFDFGNMFTSRPQIPVSTAAKEILLRAKELFQELGRQDDLSMAPYMPLNLAAVNLSLGRLMQVTHPDEPSQALAFHRESWLDCLTMVEHLPRESRHRQTESIAFSDYTEMLAECIKDEGNLVQNDEDVDLWHELLGAIRYHATLHGKLPIISQSIWNQIWPLPEKLQSEGSVVPTVKTDKEVLYTVQDYFLARVYFEQVTFYSTNGFQPLTESYQQIALRRKPDLWNATPIIIPKNSTWKYWDLGGSPSLNWMKAKYDDGSWETGQGILGYGNLSPDTVPDYGPDRMRKYLTTYFRKKFDAPRLRPNSWLLLRLLRDDGAVVYFNGQEVLRDNMPAENVTEDSLAFGGVNEERYWEYLVVPSTLLKSSGNLLAVEVHQATPSSSDLKFDLELLGNMPSLQELLDPSDIPKLRNLLRGEGIPMPEEILERLEKGERSSAIPAAKRLLQKGI